MKKVKYNFKKIQEGMINDYGFVELPLQKVGIKGNGHDEFVARMSENEMYEEEEEESSFTFSEYDFDLPEETKSQVSQQLGALHPNSHPDHLKQALDGTIDFFYSAARKENKHGREAMPTALSDIIGAASEQIKLMDV